MEDAPKIFDANKKDSVLFIYFLYTVLDRPHWGVDSIDSKKHHQAGSITAGVQWLYAWDSERCNTYLLSYLHYYLISLIFWFY